MFNATGVQVTSACNCARSWSAFCDVTFSGHDSKEYAWHSLQLNSVSVQWDRDVLRRLRKMEDTRDIDFVTFEILGTGACGFVIGANDHRMDFCLVHNIAKWSTLLKQNNWIK